MCPDPQILSVYMDGELPSPWKEKMENHLSECPACKEKFNNFLKLQEALKKSTHQERTIVELNERAQPEQALSEHEITEKAKEKIWHRLESRQRFRSRTSVWQRRLSIPLPVAAAAAVILVLFAAVWLRIGQIDKNNAAYASYNEEPATVFIASDEEPDIMPVADINTILQLLGANDSNIIILQLPETNNFTRSGEPAIIRAADYTRRQP
jgi:anti-sigma factor RsiW